MTKAEKSTLPIILLAAGQSSRMKGRDKLLEDIDGEPLLELQVKRALDATSGKVIVTLPVGDNTRAKAISGLDVEIVPVPDARKGLSASLRRGIEALAQGEPAAMILLADLPDITTEDLRAVFAMIDLTSETLIWRGATADGAPGHPIVFSQPLFQNLKNLQGDKGGTEVIAQNRRHTELIRLPDDRARRDLDTQEEWAAWRAEKN